MAVENDKIVTLSVLSHYNEKIKIWVADQILHFGQGLVFIDDGMLPGIGEEKTLYIKDDGIYKWNASSSSYTKLASGEGSSTSAELVWEPIKK